MKRSLIHAALTAIVTMLVASTIRPEEFERRQPGEGRRERYSKVGDVGRRVRRSAEQGRTVRAGADPRRASCLPGAYGAAFAALSGLPVVRRRVDGGHQPALRLGRSALSRSVRVQFERRCRAGLRPDHRPCGRRRHTCSSAAPTAACSGPATSGQTWTPLTDGLPALSIGDLRLAPDGALWLATGEANTGATAFLGTGVYRLATPSLGLVRVRRPRRRHRAREHVHRQAALRRRRHASTPRRRAASGSTRPPRNPGAWQRVLYPVPDPVVNGVPRPDLQLAYNDICNDVAIEPGSGGQHVLVNCAWRGGAAYNGFYYSADGGQTFTLVNPNGRAQPAGRRPHHASRTRATDRGSTRWSSR